MLQLHDDVANPDSELSRNLHEAGQILPVDTRVVLFLDGLDELPVGGQRDSILGFLRDLAGQNYACLTVLVASRPHQDIATALAAWTPVPIDEAAVQLDIKMYIEKSITPDKGFPQTADVQDAIIKRLVTEDNAV